MSVESYERRIWYRAKVTGFEDWFEEQYGCFHHFSDEPILWNDQEEAQLCAETFHECCENHDFGMNPIIVTLLDGENGKERARFKVHIETTHKYFADPIVDEPETKQRRKSK